MAIKFTYVVDLIVVFVWTFYARASYSPSFPWSYLPLSVGWFFLAGCIALTWNSRKYWAKWLSAVGTGLLAAYFTAAAVATLRSYGQGKVLTSIAQLGLGLAVVTFVTVCFAVALWDLSRRGVSSAPNNSEGEELGGDR